MRRSTRSPSCAAFPASSAWTAARSGRRIQEGRIDEIRNYCETDVVNTYLMYCRFQLMRGGFSPEEYADEISFVKNALALEPAPHWVEYLAAFER